SLLEVVDDRRGLFQPLDPLVHRPAILAGSRRNGCDSPVTSPTAGESDLPAAGDSGGPEDQYKRHHGSDRHQPRPGRQMQTEPDVNGLLGIAEELVEAADEESADHRAPETA